MLSQDCLAQLLPNIQELVGREGETGRLASGCTLKHMQTFMLGGQSLLPHRSVYPLYNTAGS